MAGNANDYGNARVSVTSSVTGSKFTSAQLLDVALGRPVGEALEDALQYAGVPKPYIFLTGSANYSRLKAKFQKGGSDLNNYLSFGQQGVAPGTSLTLVNI